MQMSPFRRSNAQGGVTLIELLVSIAILGIITALLVTSWIALQNSYGHSVRSSNARGQARDALARASREIRDAQPLTLTSPLPPPFLLAQPTEIQFYSAFNNPGVRQDGSGTGALRKTRIYLDTGGSSAQKALIWQRDTNNSGGFDAGDRAIILATSVVNNSVANTNVTPSTSYTAIFTYTCRNASGDITASDTVGAADLGKIVAVQIHVIVDDNLAHAPAPADLQTTVRPRNVAGE